MSFTHFVYNNFQRKVLTERATFYILLTACNAACEYNLSDVPNTKVT